jgi:hypothetical protein
VKRRSRPAVDPKTTARQRLLEVEKELNALFFKREEEIRGLICALLCGEHVLLLGPRRCEELSTRGYTISPLKAFGRSPSYEYLPGGP